LTAWRRPGSMRSAPAAWEDLVMAVRSHWAGVFDDFAARSAQRLLRVIKGGAPALMSPPC
jgi:hypothetical protein